MQSKIDNNGFCHDDCEAWPVIATPKIASPEFRTHATGTGGSMAGLENVGKKKAGRQVSCSRLWERSGQPAVVS